MKHYELEIEHFYKNKFVGKHRFQNDRNMVVLGHGRNVDIRLMGDDVSPIHAYLDYQEGIWTLIDAGSQQGTWINKKPIYFEAIKSEIFVTIGGHQLKLTPKYIEKEVFGSDALAQNMSEGANTYHQVIVKRNDIVMRTELLAQTESYTFLFGGNENVLTPPKKNELKETKFDSFIIFQRIVKSTDIHLKPAYYLAGLKSKEIRAPLLAALALIFIISALVIAIPQKPNDELADMKPDNKYTRMIFDAELMKKKRAEAKEMRKTIQAKVPNSQNTKNTLTTQVRSKGASPKIVSNLKLEGLNALLGKISKRANSKGPSIAAFGKSPDNSNTGGITTLASIGSLKGVATGNVGNGGDTYKVGGVGTFGKGGGNGRSLVGVGGLASAGAGAGTVGILDEETEIDGGLDKEVIARIIGNYLGEIRYCYERQLSAEPDLYGKVQVKFTIDSEGNVNQHRIGATTLSSAMVEGCILRRLARWKFPKPRGGTHVLVTYPFMFKSTN